MGKLIRRRDTIPVEAHRSSPPAVQPPEQVVIDVPRGAAPPPPSTAGPNVTQNIFYISAPAGAAQQPQQPPPQQQQAPPPPPPPQEIHYHTTVHHLPRVRGPRHGLSFLGSVGFVLGALGCAAAFAPQAASFARPLATAGLVAAGLGMLGAIFFGRSGKGVPLLGLLVSAVAVGLWLQKNDPRVQAEVEKLKQQVPQLDVGTQANNPPPSKNAPAAASTLRHTPPAPAAHVTTPVPAPASPVTPPAPPTIFDFGNGDNTDAAAPTPAAATPHPVTPQSSVDLATAAASVESARLAAAKRLGIEYATVKSNADKAWANLQQGRATYATGTSELRDVEQKWLDAKSMLDNICRRLRADSAVAAAEAALRNAQATPRP
jgi:hypothetical protein